MNKIKIILYIFLLSASSLFAEDYLVVIHSDLYDYGIQSHLNYLLENQQGHNLVYRQIANGIDSQDIRNIVNKNNQYNNLQYVQLIGQGRDNSIPSGKKFPAANHTVNSNNGNYLPFFYYNDHIHWDERRDLPSDWKYVEGTDLLIGRVPAKNKTQIHLWLNKLEDYYQKVGQTNRYNQKIRFFCEDNKKYR